MRHTLCLNFYAWRNSNWLQQSTSVRFMTECFQVCLLFSADWTRRLNESRLNRLFGTECVQWIWLYYMAFKALKLIYNQHSGIQGWKIQSFSTLGLLVKYKTYPIQTRFPSRLTLIFSHFRFLLFEIIFRFVKKVSGPDKPISRRLFFYFWTEWQNS